MDTRSRLLRLMDGTDFSFDTDCNDPVRFVKMWNRFVTESATFTCERQQRILDLIFLLMAEILQPVAKGKYGNASDASVRRVLLERYQEPAIKLGVEKTLRLMKEAVASIESENLKGDAICQVYDLSPGIFIDFVAEGVGRFRLVPVEETPQIAIVLADMAREVTRARNNSRCS